MTFFFFAFVIDVVVAVVVVVIATAALNLGQQLADQMQLQLPTTPIT